MGKITRNLTDPDKIIRDVHNVDDIDAKTELTALQVEATNKASTLAFSFNSGLLSMTLTDFMVKQKSLNRESMKEFIAMSSNKFTERLAKDNKNSLNLMG